MSEKAHFRILSWAACRPLSKHNSMPVYATKSNRTLDRLMCMFSGLCPTLRPNHLPGSIEREASLWTSPLECCRWGWRRLYQWASQASSDPVQKAWETAIVWVRINTHAKGKGVGRCQWLSFGNHIRWYWNAKSRSLFSWLWIVHFTHLGTGIACKWANPGKLVQSVLSLHTGQPVCSL